MSEPTWELLGGGGVVGGPIDYIGDWAAGTQYQPGQVVRYNGIDYLAVNPSLGQTPPSVFGIGAGYGTSLPGSPVNGQEYTLVDSLTNPSYQWRFRFNAGSSSAHKWEFVGGSDAFAKVNTAEGTATSATWLDLATPGPRILVPRNGDYDVVSSAAATCSAATGIAWIGNWVGTLTAAGDGVSVLTPTIPAYYHALPNAVDRLLNVPAGQYLQLRYYNGGGGTVTWAFRSIRVRPVRVS